ncbi:MAG: lipid-A-disaccharide synthase [Bacteroidales bacterium]
MKYYIIAGEASGDLHGSNLIHGLLETDPNADIRFWGGDMMSKAGGTLVRHYKDTAVMGFVEVLLKLNKILNNISFCKKDILDYNPDVLILIDYPGFNFRMAKFAHVRGIKTFYYISPKVWAWKEKRVERLRKDVDNLFIIFPFEIEYFNKKHIKTIYCGNPLIDKIESSGVLKEKASDFFKRHSDVLTANDSKNNPITKYKPYIALLAGSRKMEINYLMPVFLKFEKLLEEKIAKGDLPKYDLLLASAPSIDLSYYQKYLSDSNIQIINDDTYSVMRHADFCLISSGTASLEAALIGSPQVVCYGGNPISFAIAKHFVKLKWISLGNLIIQKTAFKELLQKQCTAENIMKEFNLITLNSSYKKQMLDDYTEIQNKLGSPGASVRVAKEMYKLLQK